MHSEDTHILPDGRKAYTIKGFCEAYPIGKTLFYELKKKGKAPIITRISARKQLIAVEDAEQWFRGWRQLSTDGIRPDS